MRSPLRILIAEDEALNALALRTQVEALGHTVVGPARNGLEAVELARIHTVDLAILDIRMPELTGIEAADQILAHKPLPIILLTGYSEPEFVAQATLAPIFHYLIKPVSLEDLTPAIGIAHSRFVEWKEFQDEAEQLRQKLEDRKTLERAKALLMEAKGLSENAAYRMLQQESQRQSTPMAELARTILAAEVLLRDAPVP